MPSFAALNPIATVRAGIFFGAAGASPLSADSALPPNGGSFGAFVIICVPGAFFFAGSGVGVMPLRTLATASWKALRWESALLTASGETCDRSTPDAGGCEPDFDALGEPGSPKGSSPGSDPREGGLAPGSVLDEEGAGGGPYFDAIAIEGFDGEAVAAN